MGRKVWVGDIGVVLGWRSFFFFVLVLLGGKVEILMGLLSVGVDFVFAFVYE